MLACSSLPGHVKFNVRVDWESLERVYGLCRLYLLSGYL